MKVYDDITLWRSTRRQMPEGTLGFVPTLGGLHAGHGSLIHRSVAENDQTVVSLFLNPTQFDEASDLDSYPAQRQADLDQLLAWGVDHVITPSPEAMYPDGYRYRMSESGLSTELCGAHRPGHFDGMLTVVLKLLNLVRADRAYFGEKDWQQLQLVQGMADALFLDTEIVPCPIVRAGDGLALSSRNQRLDPRERQKAPELHASLLGEESAKAAAARLERAGFVVDYVKDLQGRRLAAAHLGDVRLIDNIPLENHHAS